MGCAGNSVIALHKRVYAIAISSMVLKRARLAMSSLANPRFPPTEKVSSPFLKRQGFANQSADR